MYNSVLNEKAEFTYEQTLYFAMNKKEDGNIEFVFQPKVVAPLSEEELKAELEKNNSTKTNDKFTKNLKDVNKPILINR